MTSQIRDNIIPFKPKAAKPSIQSEDEGLPYITIKCQSIYNELLITRLYRHRVEKFRRAVHGAVSELKQKIRVS